MHEKYAASTNITLPKSKSVGGIYAMQPNRSHSLTAALAFAPLLALPAVAQAATVTNPTPLPQCADNTAFFDPTLPPSIDLPPGFKASVFVSGLNAPTGIAFLGDAGSFQVYVLESGHGLPSVCNDQSMQPGGEFATNNPFTPDILVFNQNGRLIRGPLGKPTSTGGGLQPEGPAIDIAFVSGFSGGRLFATDSNQSTHQHNGQKQQLAYRDRQSDDRAGHSVHHRPADRRPPN
jgi:hypothetical protein